MSDDRSETDTKVQAGPKSTATKPARRRLSQSTVHEEAPGVINDSHDNDQQSQATSDNNGAQGKKPDFLGAFTGFFRKVKRAFERPTDTSRATSKPHMVLGGSSAAAVRSDINTDLVDAFAGRDGFIDAETALAMQYMNNDTLTGGVSSTLDEDSDTERSDGAWSDNSEDLATEEEMALIEQEEQAELLAKMQQECPEGWQIHVDEASGEPFYYNPTSGECVWSLEEVMALEKGALLTRSSRSMLDPEDITKMKRDCALLVVNMQRDFFSKATNSEGATSRSTFASSAPSSVPGGVFGAEDFDSPIDDKSGENALIVAIQKLMKLPFKKVVHCTVVRPPYHCSFRTCNPGCQYKEELSVDGVGTDERFVNVVPPYCVEGSVGAEIIPQIEVAKEHLVFESGGVPGRNDFNPFFDANLSAAKADGLHTPLARILEDAGIHHVFVVGMGLEHGVAQTCIEAKARLVDAHVYYVEDCVRAFNWSQPLASGVRSRLAAAGVEAMQEVQGVRELFWRGPTFNRSLSSQNGAIRPQNDLLLKCEEEDFDAAAKLVYNLPPDKVAMLNDISPATGLGIVHMCTIAGHKETMNQLIFRAANIGMHSWLGDTALILAVKHGQMEMLDMLLDLLKNGTRKNMFMGHLQNGEDPLAALDIDAADRRGRTPLMWSVIKGELEMFTKLLEHGADVNEVTDAHQNILHFLLGYVHERAPPSRQQKITGPGSHSAVSNVSAGPATNGKYTKEQEFVRVFMRHIFAEQPRPKHLAILRIKNPGQRFVRLCQQQDDLGWSPVHVGSLTGCFADLPIKSRTVPVNLQDIHSCNAFHIASWNGQIRAIKLLLEGPSKRSWQPALQINLPTLLKQTPLDLAIANNHTKSIHMMLRFGCYFKYFSQEHNQHELELPPPALLHQLILYGATRSMEGFLCRDENNVVIDDHAISLAKLLKSHSVCTFNFTSFTNPIVQFMYIVPSEHGTDNFLSLELGDSGNADAQESEKLVCLVCREMCYPGQNLRRVRDHRRSTPMYCQCDKSTCRCLVPGQEGAPVGTGARTNANGQAWQPSPLDVSKAEETDEFREADSVMQLLATALARNHHHFWCHQRRNEGWR